MNCIINIFGPTCSGKTTFSIQLAKFFHLQQVKSEIINFDSLLFYKEPSISTARPSDKEKEGIPHHLMGVVEIDSDFNSSDFVELAKKKIAELHSKGIVPILVGGSGFYLRSLIKGMYETPTTPKEISQKVEQTYKEEGIEPFINILKINDPDSLNQLHPNDHYRLLRAVEYFWVSGKKISDQKNQFDKNSPYDFSTPANKQWNFLNIYLCPNKHKHWQMIKDRINQMHKDGLIDEISQIINKINASSCRPLKSIGPKETIDFLQGKIKTIEELNELIYIHTRQLAKSQKTFFNKITPKITLDPCDNSLVFTDYYALILKRITDTQSVK